MVCKTSACGRRTLSCGSWDLVPWPGVEPGSLALGTCSLSHWTSGEVPFFPSFLFFPFFLPLNLALPFFFLCFSCIKNDREDFLSYASFSQLRSRGVLGAVFGEGADRLLLLQAGSPALSHCLRPGPHPAPARWPVGALRPRLHLLPLPSRLPSLTPGASLEGRLATHRRVSPGLCPQCSGPRENS